METMDGKRRCIDTRAYCMAMTMISTYIVPLVMTPTIDVNLGESARRYYNLSAEVNVLRCRSHSTPWIRSFMYLLVALTCGNVVHQA